MISRFLLKIMSNVKQIKRNHNQNNTTLCFWWKNLQEVTSKKKTEKRWFHIFVYINFLFTKVWDHQLANKSRWSKCVSFHSYIWRTKLTFIYSSTLIGVWKWCLRRQQWTGCNGMLWHLALCFENELNIFAFRQVPKHAHAIACLTCSCI